MLEVTDADIAYAEDVLLPEGCRFDDERRAFLKQTTSCDVVACPGSGKTTALMAKLLILAKKMPLRNGRGVCVLTHTNVAIDEIKRRAGAASSVLFSHPNFFGTIQMFVNRFLAIPAYKQMYRRPLKSIDYGQFYREVSRLYAYPSNSTLKTWLENKHGGPGTICGYWLMIKDLRAGEYLDKPIQKPSETTPSYRAIQSIREKLLEEGILNFNDAYSLALHHIMKHPNIIKSLRHRFQFVFVDEMQDTDSHQLQLLDNLFQDSGCVICRLGDPNQAIYQGSVKAGLCWTPDKEALHFSNSMRYGESIANVLDTVRVDRRITLLPFKSRESLKPHLIVYKKGEKSKVISKFADIISDNKLDEIDKATFRAIGWVGKDDGNLDKITIGSYFPDYLKVSRNNKHRGDSLLSYAQQALSCLAESPGDCSSAVTTLWDSLVSTLRLGQKTDVSAGGHITLASVKRFLKENPEVNRHFRFELSDLLLKMGESLKDTSELRSSLADLYRKHFDLEETEALRTFLESNDLEEVSTSTPPTNEFVSEKGIVIPVSTVHSVKGETHTATLYLETSYYGVDSQRLLPFLAGEFPEDQAKKKRHQENLKVAHVAFSRPTHLMAFACCEDNVSGKEESLKEAGWIVCHIGED